MWQWFFQDFQDVKKTPKEEKAIELKIESTKAQNERENIWNQSGQYDEMPISYVRTYYINIQKKIIAWIFNITLVITYSAFSA